MVEDVLMDILPAKEKTDVFDPTVSGIYVREDSSVVSAEFSRFAEDYYDLEELKGYVEEAVAAFNEELGAEAAAYEPAAPADSTEEVVRTLPASIESLTMRGKYAYLRMGYRDTDSYISFQTMYDGPVTRLTNRTVEEAMAASVSLTDSFVDLEGEAVSGSTLTRHKGWYILTMSVSADLKEAYPVQIQGEIKYVSVNAVSVTETSAAARPGETITVIYR